MRLARAMGEPLGYTFFEQIQEEMFSADEADQAEEQAPEAGHEDAHQPGESGIDEEEAAAQVAEEEAEQTQKDDSAEPAPSAD
jgi:hypothetical protein